MDEIGVLLGGMDEGRFLAAHWQKRPLRVRGALRDPAPPFGPAEVAKLAGDPTVASRLVVSPRARTDSLAAQTWATRRGPFTATDLAALPADGWTILLHEMDRRFASLASLLEPFRFIPNWRIDDVMVSYATDGGGVGPHIDRYDVFLLQVTGRRRWRIGGAALDDERLVAGIEHPVLANVEYTDEWVAGPGDLLYLPPRFAHDGVAIGECMTCSIGFRAPDPRELCAGFLRQLGPDAFDAIRYTDPDLVPAGAAGEIPQDARDRLRESALSLFAEGPAFDCWIGCFVTSPARGQANAAGTLLSTGELRRLLDDGGRLARSAPSHFAWYRAADASVQLFVGGERYALSADYEALAEVLCGRQPLDATTLTPHLQREPVADIVRDLIGRGFLRPDGFGAPAAD